MFEIDKLVGGRLNNYGLVFSYYWVQPYWLMFGAKLVLIVVAIILTSLIELPQPEERLKRELKKTMKNLLRTKHTKFAI